ncbi:organic cation transporter protein isoform X2 [Rhopalosiphum padi]|uniref:organic cation transporter protein isoform X1 n=1 Tax=Rhopalosiphum padi TaxID=40932 RepID=UPI00298E6B18|nr:organic cation transporter protein isoform X1 [Rhopalosiphum padi]XP_060851480.1 organic cation transporter protein isoform X2 [Rhopalosiphum padi]
MTDDAKKTQSNVCCSDKERDNNKQSSTITKSDGDPVQTALGDFGWWQFWITFALSLLKFPIAWHQLAIIFLAAKSPFRCDVGDGSTTLFNVTDRCNSPDPVTHDMTPCHKFVYDRSVFQETIITEWDLVCGRFQLSNIAQSVFMLGVLIGNVLFGMFSDKYGRKIPMMFAIVLLLVAGVGTSLAPWYELFLPLRFATALAIGGLMISSFVLTMEVVGGKWRTVVSTLHHIPFNLGHMSMALISYFIRNWRQFQLAITLPSLFFFTYWWIIPESPRWLLAVGKEKQARKILTTGASRNNRKLDGEFEKSLMNSQPEKGSDENKGNLFDLFRTPNLRKKTLAVFFNWMVCGLCFYGLAQYMGEIGGNIFINVASSGLIELPGAFLCIYLMEKFGRRNTLLSANLVTALACILITFLPQNSEVEHFKFILASLGIVGSSIAFPTIYLFSGELFPTVVRNVGVGSASMCARIGSVIAPFVSSLGVFNVYLPPMIFGTVPLMGALLCLLLPETRGAQLPVTIEDGERFGLKVTKLPTKTAENGAHNSGFVADEQL